jgi:hypothetical protein
MTFDLCTVLNKCATDITMTTILKPILVEEFLKERFNARDLHQLQARDYAKVLFFTVHILE